MYNTFLEANDFSRWSMSPLSLGARKMTEEKELCVRCEKNEAVLTYADSFMDFSHGFTERICQDCFDKQGKGSEWYKRGFSDGYKQGFADAIKEEFDKENRKKEKEA